jgi:hypothetical protein
VHFSSCLSTLQHSKKPNASQYKLNLFLERKVREKRPPHTGTYFSYTNKAYFSDRVLKQRRSIMVHALLFICTDFMFKSILCLNMLFTCGMQSVRKTEVFLQSKVMPKSYQILHNSVQPRGPDWIGAFAFSNLPQDRCAAHRGGTEEQGTLCATGAGHSTVLRTRLSRKKGPLQEKHLFPSFLEHLFFGKETAPSNHRSSLHLTISYCAFGQRPK